MELTGVVVASYHQNFLLDGAVVRLLVVVLGIADGLLMVADGSKMGAVVTLGVGDQRCAEGVQMVSMA